MRRLFAPSVGLLGRIVAILLLTILIEFAASVLLYERQTEFAVRDDEARRLAEHLVISRRLVDERPPGERPAMAGELSTDRYAMRWAPGLPAPPPLAASLATMRAQVTSWEPALAATDLRLRLVSPGRSAVVAGGVALDDGSWLHFRTRQPVTNLNAVWRRVTLALIPAVALMVLGGVLVRRTLLPLRRLSEAADRLGASGVAAVPEDGPGEVRRVTAAFNRMQARIQRLIGDRTRALAAVGHDLRTPLARLRLRTEGVVDDELRAAIGGDVDEMDAMVASLLAFLGGDDDPEKPARVDLAVLCATVADDFADRGHDVAYAGPDHCETRLRPVGMKRALANLVDNAVHYGDRVAVALRDLPGALLIEVTDDGPGIPEDRLATVVEPFVRLDPARRRDTPGFGLGLSIVARVVELEGGRLTLANRAGGGFSATIELLR